MPPAARDARSAAAPSRAPWPTPSRPTKPPAQQNAAATDAAQPFVQAPSPPPSARRSCARPASSDQCNSRAAARRDPRGRSHSQSHRQTPQIAIHYRLKSGDHPYWVLSQKRESSPIIDSLHFQLRFSDSVVLTNKPLSNMAMEMALRRMKVEGAAVQSFRSSFGDWAGNVSSFPREVVETAL